jgi:hypothetical protein
VPAACSAIAIDSASAVLRQKVDVALTRDVEGVSRRA